MNVRKPRRRSKSVKRSYHQCDHCTECRCSDARRADVARAEMSALGGPEYVCRDFDKIQSYWDRLAE